MTDGEDRRIAAATIRSLASHQDEAARGISWAVMAVQGIGDNMTKTHGLICAVTNAAVSVAETERATAGNRAAGVSTELAAKLRHAAEKYDETDLAEKDKLDNQMPPR
ncbi:ESX-1 secretion-associated protein [Staphylococcus capitis]|uniref:ESX-1 secretion-associated protein n=1 Tax=Staphylococcus capitis TaxID=29388 RepID=UPI003CFFA534